MASSGASLRFVITGDNDSAIKSMREVRGEAEKQSKGIGDAFKTIGGIAAGVGVAEFFKGTLSAASDLNETVNKATVIFGKNADAVQAWAGKSETALGLSHQAALDAAASFGDMFSQIGFTGDQATNMSEKVVQMAADFGSFSNLGTDDVLERIAGGFRGEYDALQKLVPNISAARVQQEALNETRKKSVNDLTAAEKAQATLNILMKDGARAQGDFARTSSGNANQQKILAAQTEDLQAKIGGQLLPVLVKAEQALSGVLDFVEDNSKEIEILGGAVLGAWAAYKGYTILRSVATWLSTARIRYRQYVAELSYGNRVQRAQSAVLQQGTGRLAAFATGAALAGTAVYYGAKQLDNWIESGRAGNKVAFSMKETIDDWTQALVAANGAMDDNVRLSVAKKIQDTGLADKAAAAGISLRELTDAVIGGTQATDDLIAKWRESGTPNDDTIFGIRLLAGEYGQASGKAADLGSVTGKTTGATSKFGATAKDTASKAKQLKVTIDDLSGAFDKLNGKTIDATEADLDYRDSLADLRKSFKGHNDSVDLANAKGREHLRALFDSIKASQADAEATFKRTKSAKEATEAFKEDRGEILKTLTALTGNRQEAKQLIDTYAKIPKFKETKITADTSSAKAQVDDFIQHIDTLHGTVTIGGRSASGISLFASGTPSAPPGLAIVGDEGPELVNFRGGESVLSSPDTMRFVRANTSGSGGDRGTAGPMRLRGHLTVDLANGRAVMRDALLEQDDFNYTLAGMG